MKIFVYVCLVALLLCAGLSLWLRTDALPVDVKADAVRKDDVSRDVTANRRIGSGWQSPPSWIPADAERDDDRGVLLTWVATDAERRDDHGAFLTWTATDAERDDDIGVRISGSGRV